LIRSRGGIIVFEQTSYTDISNIKQVEVENLLYQICLCIPAPSVVLEVKLREKLIALGTLVGSQPCSFASKQELPFDLIICQVTVRQVGITALNKI